MKKYALPIIALSGLLVFIVAIVYFLTVQGAEPIPVLWYIAMVYAGASVLFVGLTMLIRAFQGKSLR